MSILPELGALDFRIKAKFDISEHVLLAEEDRDIWILYKTEGIWFFVDKESRAINQITIVYPCEAKLNGVIGVRDSMELVFQELGRCAKDFGEYYPENCPGVCFSPLRNSNSKSAPIESISVFDPYECHVKEPAYYSRERRLP